MDESATARSWFLRKHEDGTIFGPLSFEQLARWASTAQVAPHDTVSIDQRSWMKAPMVPELGMDWLVEITSERYYGPTTLGAIQEFIRLGEINEETFVINSCDGTRRRIQEMSAMLQLGGQSFAAPVEEAVSDFSNEPPASGISIDMPERIRDLEQSLREERRTLEEVERRYAELERKYQELLEEQEQSG
jgi:hypothetical protein